MEFSTVNFHHYVCMCVLRNDINIKHCAVCSVHLKQMQGQIFKFYHSVRLVIPRDVSRKKKKRKAIYAIAINPFRNPIFVFCIFFLVWNLECIPEINFVRKVFAVCCTALVLKPAQSFSATIKSEFTYTEKQNSVTKHTPVEHIHYTRHSHTFAVLMTTFS